MRNKSIMWVLALGILLPSAAFAGQDSGQRMLQQRMLESKRALEKAEQAKGGEQQRLMQEHMKAMDENMKLMRDMKPAKPNMTITEREEWMMEHQKLMQLMLEQMQREHELSMHGAGK
jgi:hypothetical protein